MTFLKKLQVKVENDKVPNVTMGIKLVYIVGWCSTGPETNLKSSGDNFTKSLKMLTIGGRKQENWYL